MSNARRETCPQGPAAVAKPLSLQEALDSVLQFTGSSVFRAMLALETGNMVDVWMIRSPQADLWKWHWKVGAVIDSCEAIRGNEWHANPDCRTRLDIAFGRLIHAAPGDVVTRFLRELSSQLHWMAQTD